MNKGLDLIQRQQIEAIDGYPTGNVYVGLTFEELAELEKELKALELIKKKSLNLTELLEEIRQKDYEYSDYLIGYDDDFDILTQEEYDLLKEVFYDKARDN